MDSGYCSSFHWASYLLHPLNLLQFKGGKSFYDCSKRIPLQCKLAVVIGWFNQLQATVLHGVKLEFTDWSMLNCFKLCLPILKKIQSIWMWICDCPQSPVHDIECFVRQTTGVWWLLLMKLVCTALIPIWKRNVQMFWERKLYLPW